MVCFNGEEAGHYGSGCFKLKVCFIYHQSGHVVDKCPEWKNVQLSAQNYGSTNIGLGFYHIDVEQRGNRFQHGQEWITMACSLLLGVSLMRLVF